MLYTDPNPLTQGEASARFTFYTAATLTSRNALGSLFVIGSTGTTTVYFNQAPAGIFNDPTAFKMGVPIATNSVRFQDILNVQAPNLGIATRKGELDQVTAGTLTVGGYTFQFGAVGLNARVSSTGEAARTDAVISQSFTSLAGNAVATSLSSLYLPLAQKAAP